MAKNTPNLDDISKTSFCIPYDPTHTEEHIGPLIPKSYSDDVDLENGRALRFKTYKEAWTKCLDRMQEIVHNLQAAAVNDVVSEIEQSYDDSLSGLPYPEMPVISLNNSGYGSAVLDSITARLEDGGSTSRKNLTVHLFPGDSPTLMAGMRAIVSGITEREGIESAKRCAATSLAPYDIRYLIAWYKSFVEMKGTRPHIVIFLHEFEQFDPLVMQDIFEVCSARLSELPFVFLLSMASPVPNYLNLTYPRATISLLRVRHFSAVAGSDILDKLILKTFFDPEFETDIMIGPTVLKFLRDYFSRYNPSVDAIFTMLQIVHMRHFSTDPMTVFVKDACSTEILSNPDAASFAESLRQRISSVKGAPSADLERSDLINIVEEARSEFYQGLCNVKLGLHLLLLVQSFLEEQGYSGLKWSTDVSKRPTLLAKISTVLDSSSARIIKDLGLISSKLNGQELDEVLNRIYRFINALPPHISSAAEEQHAKIVVVHLRSSLDQGEDGNRITDAATSFGEWITGYLTSKLKPLERCPLWDIWYTGLAPFPTEIVNPSIRASLLAGLLQPHAFAEEFDSRPSKHAADSLRDLPDTSILFKRYLDSSRMINAYDWFESFKNVLVDQRQYFKDPESTGSPRKRAKGKQKAALQDEVSEENEAKWDVHVQARFIRALHELDYLGLIKHTGRKPDHLMRTLFDVRDDQ